MTAQSEERARLRNALEVCRRCAEQVKYWNVSAGVWSRAGAAYKIDLERARIAAASAAIHAERAARAYFKGM